MKSMHTLDTLIAKFNEVKEELNKAAPLHDTVEGFVSGLKALPRDGAERGRFITSHMNHGPFLSALQQHPEGKQLHGKLTSYLNSPTNAGIKPGSTKTAVGSDTASVPPAPRVQEVDVVNRIIGKRPLPAPHPSTLPSPEQKSAFQNVKPTSVVSNNDASNEAFRWSSAPASNTNIKMPSQAEHADRASTFSDFMPAGKFGKTEQMDKTINQSYSSSPNETLMMSENGQWCLKSEYDYRGTPAPEPKKEKGVKAAIKRAGNKAMEIGEKILFNEANDWSKSPKLKKDCGTNEPAIGKDDSKQNE